MTTYAKPLPTPDPDTEEFWVGCRSHKLLVPKCTACGSLFWPPRPGCPFCAGQDATWEEMSGKGTVFTYVVFRRPFLSEFKEDIPYVVAIVELEESPRVRMLSNVVGCAPEDVKIGLPVHVVFEDVTDDATLFKFTPR